VLDGVKKSALQPKKSSAEDREKGRCGSIQPTVKKNRERKESGVVDRSEWLFNTILGEGLASPADSRR